jgi:asparagine synthetase B (glutamine-hydrolysing)
VCGFLFVDAQQSLSSRQIDRAIKSIARRGPDYESLVTLNDGRTWLYSSTLRVCPARPNGTPTAALSGNAFAYNGEVYDFHQTHISRPMDAIDTDAVLRMVETSKESLLQEDSDFSGFFSFLYLDSAAQTVHFASDWLGQKTLYYVSVPGLFAVASTHEAIVEICRAYSVKLTVNRESMVAYFMSRNMVWRPNNFLDPIVRVEPGRLFCYNIYSTRVSPVSRSFLDISISRAPNEPLTASEFQERLNSVILRELDRATTGIDPGASASVASGGIDSTLVAAHLLAKYPAVRIPIVSLRFGRKNPEVAAVSELLSSYRNADLVLQDSTIDDGESAASELYALLGSPLPTHSYLSYLHVVRLVARRGKRVLYGGDGPDELMSAYALHERLNVHTDFRPFSAYSTLRADQWLAGNEASEIAGEWNDQFRRTCESFLSTGLMPMQASVAAMRWFEVSHNLYSTGLLPSDIIAGNAGIEHRSPFVSTALLYLALYGGEWSIHGQQLTGRKLGFEPLFSSALQQPRCPRKMGFSGWPNEVGRRLNGRVTQATRLGDLLERDVPSFESVRNNRRLEWKLLNAEFWLSQL